MTFIPGLSCINQSKPFEYSPLEARENIEAYRYEYINIKKKKVKKVLTRKKKFPVKSQKKKFSQFCLKTILKWFLDHFGQNQIFFLCQIFFEIFSKKKKKRKRSSTESQMFTRISQSLKGNIQMVYFDLYKRVPEWKSFLGMLGISIFLFRGKIFSKYIVTCLFSVQWFFRNYFLKMEKKPDFGISISANLSPSLVKIWGVGGGASENLHYEGNKFEIDAVPKT